MRGNKHQQRATLLLIALVHSLVLLWLITRPVQRAALPRAEVSIGLTDDRGARPRSVAPKVAVVLPVVKLPFKLPVQAVAAAAPPSSAASTADDSAAPGRDGTQCEVVSLVQAAIQNDAAALSELAALPPSLRTQANAVLLWDGTWLDSPIEVSAPGSPATISTPLRDAILKTISEIDPACIAAPVVGPVFLGIVEPTRTTTLVLGSGQWHWSDVSAALAPCTNTESRCVAPAAVP